MKLSTLLSFFILLSAGVLVESCSPFTKVYSEEEPGVNLYKYHTFNWLSTETAQQGNNGPEWLTAVTQGKIRASVEEQLNRYGMKPCDEKPDLMIHYHVVIKNEVLYVYNWSCAMQGEGQYDRCNRVRPVQYREGTLIIDFIDTQNGTQIWRGVAIGVLTEMKPEEADERIKAAVEAIFKKYPDQPITFN